jgi:penicillin-binding protein 1A
MTIRLAAHIGMDKVADYAQRFGVIDNMPQHLSMALGAGETTPLKEATAYAMIVNGGLKITPTLIDRIQDRNGKTIYRHDKRACEECVVENWQDQSVPVLPETRERVVDAATAYQMVSMLQGVVERGTARRLREIGKPLAGKTGTSNDSVDTWFMGFSPDLVIGVFVGFDAPKSLGPNETGSSVAVPIFRDVGSEAFKDRPGTPFRIPPGVRLVRVNPATGMLARAGERDAIWEAFKPGTEPTVAGPVLDGGVQAGSAADSVPARDTGGLY